MSKGRGGWHETNSQRAGAANGGRRSRGRLRAGPTDHAREPTRHLARLSHRRHRARERSGSDRQPRVVGRGGRLMTKRINNEKQALMTEHEKALADGEHGCAPGCWFYKKPTQLGVDIQPPKA